MPVAVFAAVTLLLGVVMTLLAFGVFGASDPATKMMGSPGVVPPPGYSFVYRYVNDEAGISRSDLPDDWICLSEGVTSPWESCFARESGGLTVEQWVSIGTLLVGALSMVANLYVGLRGLRRDDNGPSANRRTP
jgi:hypothetical protein